MVDIAIFKATVAVTEKLKNSLRQAMIVLDEAHAELTMGVDAGSGEAFKAPTKITALHNSSL